jgi:hypothetical protein
MNSQTDPKSFNLPEVDCLGPDQIDNLGRALLSLTRELAVMTDRVLVLEELLTKQGALVEGAVDSFQPDEAFTARSEEAMGKIISCVLASLHGADGPK